MKNMLNESRGGALVSDAAEQGGPAPSLKSVQKIYSVGTLKYTFRGLVVLGLWLLWGDFCFALFESIFGRFMPLYLKELKASNTVISLLTGSIAGSMNIMFLPVISMWSDRYRGRHGRRIPFLFFVTPCTVFTLICIGWAPEISQYLYSAVPSVRMVSAASLTLILLGMLTVSWHFFNMVLVNVFRFLQKDVIPEEVTPRFLSYFQIIGTVATFIFSWYIFPHVLEERKLVCTGIGIIYLVAFLMMCFGVKEGKYPPPQPREKHNPFVDYCVSMAGYFRECLSVPIYRNLIIVAALQCTAYSCAGPFSLLFASNMLKISGDDMGKVFAWASVASALAAVPLAYLCSKFNAIRVTLALTICAILATFYAFLFVNTEYTWIVYAFTSMIPIAGMGLAVATMQMQLFPAEKFGQFFSSTNALGYGSIVIGNYLAGLYMDVVNSDYRMIFLVIAGCYIATVIPLLLIYRDWKRHGGPHGYCAPLPPPRRSSMASS